MRYKYFCESTEALFHLRSAETRMISGQRTKAARQTVKSSITLANRTVADAILARKKCGILFVRGIYGSDTKTASLVVRTHSTGFSLFRD